VPSNEQLKKLVQSAIQKTGDLAARVTYVKVVPGVYNPTTDATADTLTTYTNVPVVLTNPTKAESEYFLPDKITQKVILAALDLPVVPGSPDYFLIDGVRWEINRIKSVPGNSLWVIFIQEP
jgi:hypothetical protein